jgi:hypothetical protein
VNALKLPAEHGYFAVARKAIDDAEERGWITPSDLMFLKSEFEDALSRVNSIASTIGTAGSFLLALIAIAVSLTAGLNDKTSAVNRAADNTASVASRCVPASPSVQCTKLEIDHAVKDLNDAQGVLSQTSALTRWQAIGGFLILLGFFSALFSQLINPVLTPAAGRDDGSGISEWRRIILRYQWKRGLVLASFCLQGAAALIVVLIAAAAW